MRHASGHNYRNSSFILWTWLWGKYHVPQNVFLVLVIFFIYFWDLSYLNLLIQIIIITALHVMQTRYSEENSVRLSVRPSVTRVYCDKTVERSVQIYISYERTFSLVSWGEEWLVGGDPFYVKFWVNRPP